MTDPLPPLFASQSSVYRRQPHPWQDEDEAAVEASIPSTPIDEVEEFPPAPSAASSARTRSQTRAAKSPEHSSEGHSRVKTEVVEGEGMEHVKREGSTPLREVDDHGNTPPRDISNEEDADIDDRQCRICFGGAEEEPSQGRLISPCLCTGSMRYVHVNCINAWRGTGSNAKAFMECPQCHHQYRLRRTLVSGLATSRPVLIILTTLMFSALTIFTGSILHLFLSHSTTIRNRIYTARTPVSNVFQFNDDDDYWDNDDGTVIIIGGGGTLIYDIVIGAIQMFTALAIQFAQTQSVIFDIMPEPVEMVFFWLGIRFLLGLAVMGSFSFLSLLLSFSLFGPLQLFNSIRGIGLFRNFTRRRAEGGRSFSQIMIVAFVLIGTVNTLFKVYSYVESLTHRLLVYVETQILEVNPDDRRRAREEERRRRTREASWIRRWAKEGRWKTWRGWWEILLRFSLFLKHQLRAKWEAFKARMEQPMDPFEVAGDL